MPFDKYGFLGKEIQQIVIDIHAKYKETFELASQINELAQTTKYKYEINRNNSQHLVAAGLFIKVLNGFQSSVILSERGLVPEAMFIIRANIQTIVLLKLICENESFVEEYIDSEKVTNLKLMNAILDDPDHVFTGELKDYVTRKKRDKLKKEIKEKNIKALNIEQLARRASLETFYQTAYRSLSSDEHSSPTSLNRYYEINDKGEITSLESIPQTKGLSAILSTGISIVLIALDVTSTLFDIDITSEIERIEKRLSSVVSQEDDNIL